MDTRSLTKLRSLKCFVAIQELSAASIDPRRMAEGFSFPSVSAVIQRGGKNLRSLYR